MHIELNFEERSLGGWSIETFYENDIKYQRLIHKGIIKMINTPNIVVDFEHFLTIADGSILINGLGFGMCLVHLLKKDTVTDITVVEFDKELVEFIRPFFAHEDRCTIIHADALIYEPPIGKRYNYVWHDIWTIQAVKNVKEIDFLMNKYKDIADWQGAWREKLCREQAAKDAIRLKILRGED